MGKLDDKNEVHYINDNLFLSFPFFIERTSNISA